MPLCSAAGNAFDRPCRRAASGIIGVSRDNKTFIYNAEKWREIVLTPKTAYRRYVVQPKKLYGLRSFAIDSPQDVVSHCINHEIGHMVFNRSTLESKEKLLKNLWENSTATISNRANANEREFFAEAFAIYEKGGILDMGIKNFIDEIIK